MVLSSRVGETLSRAGAVVTRPSLPNRLLSVTIALIERESLQMSTNKGFLQKSIVPIAVAMAIVVPVQPVVAAVAVGQTASADARVDGVSVPSGTTLLSPAVVETGDLGAVLHLTNGEVVALAPRSTAVVASVDDGIRIAVEEGHLAYTADSGEMETLSSTETILIAQQGQIQEGERITPAASTGSAGSEKICELQNWSTTLWQTCTARPKADGCDWELVEVASAEAAQHVDKTGVLACKDRNNLGLDCDCNKPVGAIAWWIPVAAVAGGVALYEIIQDDDETPASPTTP